MTTKARVSHTPGPWSDENQNSITADFGGVGICILEPLQDFWCGDCARHPQGAEMLANARLIAAAPDLLEACKGLLEMLTEWDAKGDGMSGFAGFDAVVKAEDTIAKAESR